MKSETASALDYLAEWLTDASESNYNTENIYNIMYQIAEGVYSQVFPTRSLRVFARNYIVWDDSIYPQHNKPLYDSYTETQKEDVSIRLIVPEEKEIHHQVNQKLNHTILDMNDI